MISQDHKFIFIHIPKTAGSSVYSALGGSEQGDKLFGYNKPLDLYLQHLTVEELLRHQFIDRADFDHYFKFCFVRNPWDRIVSEWLWRTNHVPLHNRHRYFPLSLRSFIQKIPTWRGKVGDRIRRHCLPQHQFVFDDKGQLMVDYVGKFEKLSEDCAYICSQVGLSDTELPWSNSSAKRKADYRTYYDDETYQMVKDLYAKDIEYFDYHI